LKHIVLLSAVGGFLLSALPAQADTTAAPAAAQTSLRTLAPADRYFGQLKMSVLGMRNAIKDISAYADAAAGADVSNLLHKLTLVDDAVRDLKAQFPRDTWVPQLGLSLAQAFAKIHCGDAAVRANDTLDWVISDYPLSDQAFTAKGLRTADFASTTSPIVPIEALASTP